MKRWVLSVLLSASFAQLAIASIDFRKYGSDEFSPARGERFEIPYRVSGGPQQVEVSIFTSDGDLVRVLTESNPEKSGDGTLVWDGKDEDGDLVPDEAYVPVLTAVGKDGRKTTRDPRSDSGGELVDDVGVEITPSKDISYHLPSPSRVLIRAGI